MLDSACSSDAGATEPSALVRAFLGVTYAPPSRGSLAVRLAHSRWWVVLWPLLLAAGCASVRPEDKEHLAQPAMTWGGEGLAEEHEQHMLDNREASAGGGDTRGGGCGCN